MINEYDYNDSCIEGSNIGISKSVREEQLRNLVLTIKIPVSIANKTKGWKYKDKTTLNLLIANLIQKQDKIYYSRDTSVTIPKKYNPKNISNYKIVNAVDYLHNEGLITSFIAPKRFNTHEKAVKEVSWCRATSELIEMFEDCNEEVNQSMIADRQCVLLKSNEGDLVNYRDNNKSSYVRDRLQFYNVFASTVSVTYDGTPLTTVLDAHFKESFDQYGRLYARGNSYQTMPKTHRHSILVDGSPTVEIDFSCLHLRMLFDMYKLHDYVDGVVDLYSLVTCNTSDRPLVKEAVNIYMNAKTRGSAILALAQKMRENYQNSSFSSARDVIECVEESFSFLFKNESIMANLRCGNKPIGAMLQNRESEMCLDIISSLAEVKIFVGAIHDSFFFKFEDYDVVSNVIGNTYRKHMSVLRPVDVSVIFNGYSYKEKI